MSWRVALACVVLLVPARAWAAAPAAPGQEAPAASPKDAPASARAPASLGAHVWLGGEVGGGGSVAFGADALLRYRVVEAGPFCHVTWAFGSARESGCGGMLGLSLVLREWTIEAAGVLGRRSWSGVGAGQLFSGPPGAQATLTFAGARVGASMHLHWFVVGVWAGLDDDLQRKYVTYTYEPVDYIGPPSSPVTAHANVGAVTAFFSGRIGIDFDL